MEDEERYSKSQVWEGFRKLEGKEEIDFNGSYTATEVLREKERERERKEMIQRNFKCFTVDFE